MSRDPLRELYDQNWETSTAATAHFEITYRCNHACDFCCNAPVGRNELTTEELLDAIRKVAEFNILWCSLSGGEPMLRKDFWEIAAAVRSHGMALRIYTNGYLIDEAAVERLLEVKPFHIEISVHGDRAETHDATTRVPGSFDKLLRAFELLRDSGLRVILKTPITRQNQEQLWGIYAIGERFGYPNVFDPNINPRDDGDRHPLQYAPTSDFLRRFWSDEYAKLRKGAYPKPMGKRKFNCGTGRTGLLIDPYGNIYPCALWRRRIANVKQVETLASLWKGSAKLHEVRRIAEEMPKKLEEATEAGQFVAFCMGLAEQLTGDPTRLYTSALEQARFKAEAYEARSGKKTLDATR